MSILIEPTDDVTCVHSLCIDCTVHVGSLTLTLALSLALALTLALIPTSTRGTTSKHSVTGWDEARLGLVGLGLGLGLAIGLEFGLGMGVSDHG